MKWLWIAGGITAAGFFIMILGFGYQISFGHGSRLKTKDRRWYRFDWIWAPLPDSEDK